MDDRTAAENAPPQPGEQRVCPPDRQDRVHQIRTASKDTTEEGCLEPFRNVRATVVRHDGHGSATRRPALAARGPP
ncbi:hypothetical protein PYK79_08345 [Streptomyces sp. ID05-04B]|nr:hypothetical protein [Streptomyces sp. ID05-04B]